MGVGMGLCNTAFIVSIQAAVPWTKRGAATSSCLFLRFIGQALGAASFGAVLNATIQHRAPQAVGLVNRLLEPGIAADAGRGDAGAVDRPGLGRAAQCVLAGGRHVGGDAAAGAAAAGAAQPVAADAAVSGGVGDASS